MFNKWLGAGAWVEREAWVVGFADFYGVPTPAVTVSVLSVDVTTLGRPHCYHLLLKFYPGVKARGLLHTVF